MAYSRQHWLDDIEGGTPISAERLNVIEAGIESAASVADTAYVKPITGIPGVHLDDATRASLALADTAAQPVDIPAPTTSASDLTTGTLAPERIADASLPVDKLSTTGTPGTVTYLRGDGSWSTPDTGSTTTDASLLTSGILAPARIADGSLVAAKLSTAVQTSLGKADAAYAKPGAGIPETDLAAAVQTSLGKADAAIPASQKGAASGVAPLGADGKVPTANLPAGGSGQFATGSYTGDGTTRVVPVGFAPVAVDVWENVNHANLWLVRGAGAGGTSSRRFTGSTTVGVSGAYLGSDGIHVGGSGSDPNAGTVAYQWVAWGV